MDVFTAQSVIDAWVMGTRNDPNRAVSNPYISIDDLPLTHHQKLCVLEWFAHKLCDIVVDSEIDEDPRYKSYDPLTIEGNTAHSYAFELGDGGRHHDFTDLRSLEDRLVNELVTKIVTEFY